MEDKFYKSLSEWHVKIVYLSKIRKLLMNNFKNLQSGDFFFFFLQIKIHFCHMENLYTCYALIYLNPNFLQ